MTATLQGRPMVNTQLQILHEEADAWVLRGGPTLRPEIAAAVARARMAAAVYLELRHSDLVDRREAVSRRGAFTTS